MILLGSTRHSCMMLLSAVLSLAASGQQAMPNTAGETLSGKRIVLANVVPGHETILVAGFSHEGGMKTADWMKAIQNDKALDGVSLYEVAMLASAPGFVRGMIKSGMRKGQPVERQDHTVVLTEDEKVWQTYFGVENDQVPYVLLIGGNGAILWRGHGEATEEEPKLRAAVQNGSTVH